MKRKILIITTKNCLGCSIQTKNVQTAIAKSSKNIELEVKDFSELPKRVLAKYKAYDYPFTSYELNDVVKFTSTGSCALAQIQRYIDLYI
uniref:Thioredoxin family protein n=1 Tax=Geladintestivirus 4 TaxID=3233136 RepID=A0AAU8MHE1_9CAUD